MSEKETRLYEAGFLLNPQFTEAEIVTEVDKIKSAITKAGGAVTGEGTPEFIDLSYPMEKVVGSARNTYNQAYFGWVKFEAEPAATDAIKAAVEGLADVIRYILLKTDADNSVVFKKPKESPRREAQDVEISLTEEDLNEEVEEHEKLPELAEDIATDEPVVEEKE